MKAFQRILAVLLCLVMSLGMISMVASAATVFTSGVETGTLTIHKYNTDSKGENGDGSQLNPAPDYPELDEVEFTVYRVMDKTAFET